MSERWQRIARITMDPDRHLPAIEALKVGDWYFVRDGNHRVSVARQLDAVYIDAEVWEYADPVIQLAPHAEIEILLIEASGISSWNKRAWLSCVPTTRSGSARPAVTARCCARSSSIRWY
jgi:hypothetical protein